MVGVEFASPTTVAHDIAYKKDTPNNMAARVAKKCLEKGLFLLTTSIYQVVRFIPYVSHSRNPYLSLLVNLSPLNISADDMAKGCKIFAEAVEEVVQEG